MTPEEQIGLLQRKCERYHREVESKDDEIAAARAGYNRQLARAEKLEADLPRVKMIELEIARLREVIVDMRTEAKTLGFDNHEKRKRVAELEADVERRAKTLELRNRQVMQLQSRIKAYEEAVARLEAQVPHPGDGSCEKCGKVPSLHIPTSLCPDCFTTEERTSRLEQALREAIKALHVFHGEPGWESYVKGSPEMKRWRALLEAPRGEERTA